MFAFFSRWKVLIAFGCLLALADATVRSPTATAQTSGQCPNPPCENTGAGRGSLPEPIAIGVAIGALIYLGVKSGFFANIGNVLKEVGEDVWDFVTCPFCSKPKPPPPKPTPVDLVKDQGRQYGTEVGRQGPTSPIARPETIPPPRPPAPAVQKAPETQGTTTPTPIPQTAGPRAGDPASRAAATDPVDLHRGEFVYSVVDHDMAGEEPALSFVRSYRSRVDFEGSLGPAWDHNFYIRIFQETNRDICAEELTVHLGGLRAVPMRPAGDALAGMEHAYKPVTSGLDLTLVRHSTESRGPDCHWELTLPDARRYCFDEAGLAKELIWPTGNTLKLEWQSVEQDGAEHFRVERVRRVLGERETHRLHLLYDPERPTRLTSTFVTLGGEILLTAVSYEYTPSLGQLWRVQDAERIRATYTYSDVSRFSMPARVPLEGLRDYCQALCAPERPVGCSAEGSYCQRAAESTVPQCASLCDGDCASACESSYVQSRTAIIDACMKGDGSLRAACTKGYEDVKKPFVEGCIQSCKPECEASCSDVAKLKASCDSGCMDSCLGVATDANRYVYGRELDLLNNLESVVDGEGRRIVFNKYGEDPRFPSFDAVIRQQQGIEQPELALSYADLAPPRKGGVFGLQTSAFADVVAASAISEIGSGILARTLAPDGTLRLCALNQLYPVASATLVPKDGRLLLPIADGRLPRQPMLKGESVTLAEVLPDGRLRVDAVPAWFPQAPALSYGDLFSAVSVGSDRVLSLARAEETIVLEASRVSSAPAPTVGAIQSVRDIPLYAAGSLAIRNDVQVLASSGAFARVANGGPGKVTVGVGAKLGSIQARGPVELGINSHVYGDVEKVGKFEPEAGAKVDGTISEGTSLPSWPLDLKVVFPTANAGDVNVDPDSVRTLVPGAYRKLNVYARSKLHLSSGAYYLDELTIEPDSELHLATSRGAVYLYVKNRFTFSGKIASDRSGHDGLFVGYFGATAITMERSFSGTIVAPNAQLILASVGATGHSGSFFARDIEVRPATKVFHFPFRDSWTGPTRSTPGTYDASRTFPQPVRATLPARVRVLAGTSKSGSVTLTHAGGTCRYVPGAGITPSDLALRFNDTFFQLSSCTNQAKAGDTLASPSFSLRVEGGVPDQHGEVRVGMELRVHADGTAENRLLTALGAFPGDVVAMTAGSRGFDVLGVVQGAIALTRGTCREAFTLERKSDGSLRIDPPQACDDDLRLVPIAALTPGLSEKWEAIAQGAPFLDVRSFGAYDPREHVAEPALARTLDVGEWSRALATVQEQAPLLVNPEFAEVALVGPGLATSRGSGELLLSQLETLAANQPDAVRQRVLQGVARLRASEGFTELDGAVRPFEELPWGNDVFFAARAPSTWIRDLRGLFEALYVDPRPFEEWSRPFGSQCDASRIYKAPFKATSARETSRARWATHVRGSDREELIAYYNRSGDNLRLVNVTRSLIDDYEYDANHNRVGSLRHSTTTLDPIGPRFCATADERGLVTSSTRIATSGQSLTQCFDYDSEGPWLTRASRPGNPNDLVLSRAYDNGGRVLVAANDGGERTRSTYSAGRLETVTDPSGTVTRFADYDEWTGLPREMTEDAGGIERRSELTYDPWGHVQTVERPGWGPFERWEWLDHFRLDYHTLDSEDGAFAEIYSYNGSGQVATSRGVGVNDTRSFSYDSAGALRRIVHTSEGRTRTTCYVHRSDGSIAEVVDWRGARWREQRSYAGTDRASAWTVSPSADDDCALPPEGLEGELPSGVLRTQRIDGADRVIEISDGAGVVTTFDYDPFGRPFSARQGSGEHRLTSVRYHDELDRVVATLELEGEVTAPASLTESTSLNAIRGAVRAGFTEYDRAGRVRRVVDSVRHPTEGFAKARESSSVFDVRNRTVVTTDITAIGNNVRTVVIDALGRLASDTDTAGNSLTATYPDLLVQDLLVRGPEGSDLEIERTFTDRNALRAVYLGDDQVLYNLYDTAGRLTQSEDEGTRTSIAHDGFGQIARIDRSPRGSSNVLEFEAFEHDDRARRVAAFSGERQVATYGYDLLGRRVRETRPASVPGVPQVDHVTAYVGGTERIDTFSTGSGRDYSFTYVPGRPLVDTIQVDATGALALAGPPVLTADFDYSALGAIRRARILRGTSSLSTVDREVDGAGRVISDKLSNGLTSRREYGLGLGLTSLINNGERFAYVRQLDGRLTSIDRGNTALVEYGYLGAGGPKTIRYGNGVVETRQHDERGRLLAQELDNGFVLNYGYGADGHTRGIATTLGDSAGESLLMTLDGAGRVTSELRGVPGRLDQLTSGSITNDAIEALRGQAAAVRAYDLDSSSNWTAVSDLTRVLYEPEPDRANAYETTPLGAADYDRDGRLVRAGTRQFRYDAFGNLVEVTDAEMRCEYRTDALGRRINESCNGKAVGFGYDGLNLVAEQSDGQLVRTVHADGLNTPVARLAPSGATYLVAGKDRSIHGLLDASGRVLSRNRYTAFGETTTERGAGAAATGNRFGFQGHIFDAATGMYQMRARYYAPGWGRFITPDPLGAGGGTNLYAFAGNRPGDLWDPFGLTAQSTPNGDRMSSQPPEPCVTNCETRDGRDRLDSFDPRTDREKINDALEQALRDPCDSSMASCPEPGNPLRAFEGSSNPITALTAETDRYELYQRKLQAELDRDALQSVPSPGDLVPATGLIRSARTLGTALREINASRGGRYVYQLVDDVGDPVYYGISNSPLRRLGEHAVDPPGPFRGMQVISGELADAQARALETSLIQQSFSQGRLIYNSASRSISSTWPVQTPMTVSPTTTFLNPQLYPR